MKNFRNYIILLLALMLVGGIFVSCSKSGSSQDNPPVEDQVDPDSDIHELPETPGIVFEDENEAAKLEKVKSDPSQYVGTWKATSDQAYHLYGNLDLTVNEDGTWHANITDDDDYNGTWEDEGDHLHMNGERFSFDLAFVSSGNLILYETGDGYEYHTVLTKQ